MVNIIEKHKCLELAFSNISERGLYKEKTLKLGAVIDHICFNLHIKFHDRLNYTVITHECKRIYITLHHFNGQNRAILHTQR